MSGLTLAEVVGEEWVAVGQTISSVFKRFDRHL